VESLRGSSAGSSTGSSKLAGGIRAAARARDREREGRWEGERVNQGELGARFEAAGREVARGTEVGHASAMVGRALVHGHHEVISSSTWRALLCPTWSPFLGQLCSELGYGP